MKKEVSRQHRPLQLKAFAQQALIPALHLHISGLFRRRPSSKYLQSLTEAREKSPRNDTVSEKRYFVIIFSAGFLLGQ